jgi:Zn-dependent M16 (insulinase) family peptidase
MERVAVDDVPYLPLLGAMISSFGTATHDETTFSRRIDAQTGGLGAGPQTLAVPGEGGGGAGFAVGKRNSMSAYWMVSGKATSEKAGALFGLAREMLTDINLDNRNRVVEILTQTVSSMQSSVVSSASAATSLLQARLTLADDLDERMAGLSAMAMYKEALAQAEDDWPTLLARFERMRTAVLHADGAIVNLSADAPSMAAALKHVPALLESLPCDALPMPPPRWGAGYEPTASGVLVPINVGLQVPTQVNYVAKCGAIYAPGEKVSGATSVITRYLGTAYLWDEVRVQGGAYGCSLGFSQVSGIATYSSYRDPNVARTLQAYDRTGEFLRANPLSAADLSKAIIGATGDLDAPQSVYSKGSIALRRHMLGVTLEDRQIWRDQVLGTTAADFVEFADRLDTLIGGGSVAAVASESAIADANRVLPEGRRLEARRIL